MEKKEACLVEVAAYEAPEIETMVTPEDFEREVFYAGAQVTHV